MEDASGELRANAALIARETFPKIGCPPIAVAAFVSQVFLLMPDRKVVEALARRLV